MTAIAVIIFVAVLTGYALWICWNAPDRNGEE